ncbi:MAG: biotin--[acetyl-CoA-carboxylase] ligase [Cyclobacteriaceae bacterium]
MHKYFANTLFLGKNSIYLPECHSTNAEAMELVRKEAGNHGTLIHTDYQTQGRGQKGNVWISEPKVNLLFSLILKLDFLNASQAYLLNIMTCLALRDVVSRMLGNVLVEIKWPNDIYVSGKKVGGILIETVLRGRMVDYAIVGIGLNVNQTHFSLTNATSLSIEKGVKLNRNIILDSVLKSLEHYFLLLRGLKFDFMLARYHENLMWRNELRSFQIASGDLIEGKISGIDNQGRLIITHGNLTKHYEIKEVSFIG